VIADDVQYRSTKALRDRFSAAGTNLEASLVHDVESRPRHLHHLHRQETLNQTKICRRA